MIVFHEIKELPSPPEGKAEDTVSRSLCLWSVTYVPLNETKDHITLGYFGLIPLDYLARTGYIWLMPADPAPRKALQEAKHAFQSFLARLPWQTYAYTEVAKKGNRRFAEFMGYRHAITADGYHFFERPSDVD